MKKSKRPRPVDGKTTVADVARAKAFVWWPWVAALASLFLTFAIYGPALNGAFVLDDLYLPFSISYLQHQPLSVWLGGTRPMLDFSFWINYQWSGIDPYSYHATNVFLHFLTAILAGLIAMRLLEWAETEPSSNSGPPSARRSRALGIFVGALFLVHPMQTESVAYIASRSEVLSVLCYYAAYCVFLYHHTEQITWTRALFVTVLFGAAVASKQHTLTLPLLLLLTDLYWRKGGLKAHWRVYAILAAAGIAGVVYVWQALNISNSAGFHVPGMTPLTYFFTQCRVVWTYTRLFFFPFGQNADPDIAMSNGLLDHGAILALAAWVAVAAAAWVFRKRWPLASFGVFVYLLLLAPTSSFVPIQDVMQERRLYLPFLGLALVVLELLRRFPQKQRMLVEAPVLLGLAMLTYQRSGLWGDSLALWQDTAAKSPAKVRPRFQLAFAYAERGEYGKAVENYEIASRLAPPDYQLMVDWGKALDDAGRLDEAADKFQAATALEYDPEAWVLMGEVRGKQHRVDEALVALDRAQQISPGFELTYAIRGNVYESVGNLKLAAEQYQRVLELDPANDPVRKALERVRNR
jgi:tetratricopeptide (TPR) repeat protein